MSNYLVKRIDKATAKQYIINHHYSHAWSLCKYPLALYKDDNFVVGIATYGPPVGRHAALSISPEVGENEVLELTRLWVADSEEKNTESYFLGQTFRWLKDHAPEIKVLISYSDPVAGHIGTIYQATNWIYQGRNSDSDVYFIDGKYMHSRSVGSKYGTRSVSKLEEMNNIKSVEIKKIETKFRYIYILANKREKKKIINTLYRKPLPYEKGDFEATSVYKKKYVF